MRKREIQSITLKLSELKEYDVAKQERASSKTEEEEEEEEAPTSSATLQPPLVKVGPKSKQEIRERIGLND